MELGDWNRDSGIERKSELEIRIPILGNIFVKIAHFFFSINAKL
jgi:hypothetical protein